MKIYDSKYKSVEFNEEEALMITKWNPTSKELVESTFKEQIKIWLNEVLSLKPTKLLIDTTDFQFILEPDVQDWFDREVFSAYPKAGVQKKAFLHSVDYVAQVSLEQHTHEIQNSTFDVAFFATKEEALEWLLS